MVSTTKPQDSVMKKDQSEGGVQELQTHGRELYRQKQFGAALECFTEILALDPKDEIRISVLDNRAATHAALGNLQAALSDGRRMIRFDKTSCLGYLRTGKVLHLLGNYEMARDLYEMGTTKVPSNDPSFPLLRTLHEKLVQQLAPPKAVDPLQTLPLELIEMVMPHLEFAEICSCLRVSKSWHQTLRATPNLWKNLDLGKARRPVPFISVRNYVKYGKGLASRLVLPGAGSSNEKILKYMTTICTDLRELEMPFGIVGRTVLNAVPCAGNLKSLVIGSQCQITADCVDQLLRMGQKVERAEFHNVHTPPNRVALDLWHVHMPMLKVFVMNSGLGRDIPIGLIDMGCLVPTIPNVHTLILRSWSMLIGPSSWVLNLSALKQLETLDVSGMLIDGTMQFPAPSPIRRLDVSRCSGVSPSIDTDQFKALVWVSIAENHGMDYHCLERLLDANKGNLTHFNGRRTMCYDTLRLAIIAGYFTKVMELNLDYSEFNDNLAGMLARSSTALRSLSVKGTKVTGVGIASLLNNLKHDESGPLEYLNLDYCDMCGRDAVDLARSKGVKVSFSLHSKDLRGRRLRAA